MCFTKHKLWVPKTGMAFLERFPAFKPKGRAVRDLRGKTNCYTAPCGLPGGKDDSAFET